MKYVNKIRNNDIAIKTYLAFAVLLVMSLTLSGGIFLNSYQKNYIQSYTNILTDQGKIVASRVQKFEKKKKEVDFQKYSNYLVELEKETDVWIVSNPNAEEPLGIRYTNADTKRLTQDMYGVLNDAFAGKISSSDSFDRVYGMFILRVAVPIYRQGQNRPCGAVMMIAMLDKQHMGIREGKSLLVASMFLGLLISAIAAIVLTGSLMRPIKRMDRRIMRLTEGDYHSIQVKHPETQLGRLENALNELGIQLEKVEKEHENLEQVRRDFFANVSHELRTPITVMRGYTESLADGVVTEEKQTQEFYQRMLKECREMERLVGDLFILSKMQNPDFQIEKEPVSLCQMFEDVIRNASMLGKEKDIQIHTDFPKDNLCMMLGDYGRLRQMFLIVLDNAIKFSGEKGIIDITMHCEHEMLSVSIRDYGMGISKEDLPYIFEKFYKSKLKQNEKGTGLGLVIASQIAKRHDGMIEAKSEVGEGTEFLFTFPECTNLEQYE